MLLFPSSSMRASANTPAETTGACVARFPVAGSLPRYNGGAASASCFSRPARRLLAFSPAWSLNRLTRPFDARVLQSISLPPRTALAATNRSDSCCAGFAPARRKRLSTAHVVLAGSKARIKEIKTCPDGIRAFRRQLVEDLALVKEPHGEFYRFERDVPFGSPSGAASMVYGGNANGRQHWKVEGSDLSYGEWRDKRLAAAQGDSA